jgi:hypothetical protein
LREYFGLGVWLVVASRYRSPLIGPASILRVARGGEHGEGFLERDKAILSAREDLTAARLGERKPLEERALVAESEDRRRGMLRDKGGLDSDRTCRHMQLPALRHASC